MGASVLLKKIGGIGLNVGASIADGLGFKVTDALKAAGVIKDPAAEVATLNAMQALEKDLADQDTQRIQAVNSSMQMEAKSEHWLQWAWRPLFGLAGALVIFNNYFILPYLQGFGMKPIEVPDKVWEVILSVVGITAFTRGGEKIAAIWKAAGK